jgi:hypothetical protein
VRRRWGAALAAAEINFIRQLAPLQKFDLVTRVVTWDEKYAYMEHRFESDGALCAHAFARGLFLEKGRPISNAALIAELGYAGETPPFPDELRIWAEMGSVKKQNA